MLSIEKILSADTIFTSLKWFIVFLAILSTAGAIAFPTAEAQTAALGSIFSGTSSVIDTPTALTFIWILWIALIMSQTSWKMLKVSSDRIIMEGMDHPESCICSDLHTKGDLGFIRVGGAKLVPEIKGKSVWINPLTHIHKYDKFIIMEAHAAPDTGLGDVPPELIYDIYQRRTGLFGIDKCSVGYLSSKEQQEHPEFNGEDYGEKKELWNTSTFVTSIMAMNKAVSVMFDYFGDDTTPIEKKLASIKRIGAAATQDSRKKGLMDYFMVNE